MVYLTEDELANFIQDLEEYMYEDGDEEYILTHKLSYISGQLRLLYSLVTERLKTVNRNKRGGKRNG